MLLPVLWYSQSALPGSFSLPLEVTVKSLPKTGMLNTWRYTMQKPQDITTMAMGIPIAYKSKSSKAEFGSDMFHCSRSKSLLHSKVPLAMALVYKKVSATSEIFKFCDWLKFSEN